MERERKEGKRESTRPKYSRQGMKGKRVFFSVSHAMVRIFQIKILRGDASIEAIRHVNISFIQGLAMFWELNLLKRVSQI